jgi:hypothetical protein
MPRRLQPVSAKGFVSPANVHWPRLRVASAPWPRVWCSRWAGIPLRPLLLLVLGLMFISHLNREGQIQAAADVDAAILVDELPPAAYSDPGFAEFVRSARQ